MKKYALFLAVALTLLSSQTGAVALEQTPSEKAMVKFARGVTNVATSPGEFVNQVPPAMEQSPDYLTGFMVSLGRGLGYALLRAGAGIYDIATFPFPGSTHYGPIMNPETIVTPVADTTISQTLGS